MLTTLLFHITSCELSVDSLWFNGQSIIYVIHFLQLYLEGPYHTVQWLQLLTEWSIFLYLCFSEVIKTILPPTF